MTMIIGPHAISLRLMHLYRAGRAWSDVDDEIKTRPRVLNRVLLQRLGLVNRAVRSLRAMGLPIESQSLENKILAGGPPLVRIRRDPTVSIAPLLDAAGPRVFVRLGSARVTFAHCMFEGVMVMWEERP